ETRRHPTTGYPRLQARPHPVRDLRREAARARPASRDPRRPYHQRVPPGDATFGHRPARRLYPPDRRGPARGGDRPRRPLPQGRADGVARRHSPRGDLRAPRPLRRPRLKSGLGRGWPAGRRDRGDGQPQAPGAALAPPPGFEHRRDPGQRRDQGAQDARGRRRRGSPRPRRPRTPRPDLAGPARRPLAERDAPGRRPGFPGRRDPLRPSPPGAPPWDPQRRRWREGGPRRARDAARPGGRVPGARRRPGLRPGRRGPSQGSRRLARRGLDVRGRGGWAGARGRRETSGAGSPGPGGGDRARGDPRGEIREV
ncbi:MAG: Porphobilinogen deaminase, partial [uncultured Rubrobacteraceae bacterium]